MAVAVNTTELLTLLRTRGIALARFTPVKLIEETLLGDEEDIPHSLLERHRQAIKEWAEDNWEDIYYQIECPLKSGDGCTTCPDFTVVSCLVYNRHIFNPEKEMEHMNLNWTSIIIALCKSGRAHGAGLIRSFAAEQTLVDAKATRLALAKIAAITEDLTEGNPLKSPLVYMGMTFKDIPEAVSARMRDANKKPDELLLELAAQLEAPSKVVKVAATKKTGKGDKPETPEPTTPTNDDDEDTAEKPGPFPGIQSASAVTTALPDDDDDDDDDEKAGPPPPSDSAPLPPHQDPRKYLKTAPAVGKETESSETVMSAAELIEALKGRTQPQPVISSSELTYGMVREAVRQELTLFLSRCVETFTRALLTPLPVEDTVRTIEVKLPGRPRAQTDDEIPDLVDDDDD